MQIDHQSAIPCSNPGFNEIPLFWPPRINIAPCTNIELKQGLGFRRHKLLELSSTEPKFTHTRGMFLAFPVY